MNHVKKLSKFLDNLKFFHNPREAKGLGSVTVNLIVKTPDGVLRGSLRISEAATIFEPELSASADLEIETDLYTFFDVILGLEDINDIIASGKLSFKGDLNILKRLPWVFTRNYDETNIKYYDEVKYDYEENYVENWVTPSRVLVLNGSPRVRRGFTWEFLQHLVNGMESEETNVEIIDIYDPKLRIEPCYGCFVCQSTLFGECPIKDDARRIIEKMQEYDLVVFAAPVYTYSIPSKLKALLDRTFMELQPFFISSDGYTRHPLWKPKRRFFALFAVSGYPEIQVFKPVELMFEGLARDAHAPLLAKILRPGAWLYKLGYQYLKYYNLIAQNLVIAGRQLVRKGTVDPNVLSAISRQYIPKDQYYRFNNAYWLQRLMKIEKQLKR